MAGLHRSREAITATDANNVGQFYVRNSNGDPSAARRHFNYPEHRRSGIHVALQRIPRGPDQRFRRAWL